MAVSVSWWWISAHPSGGGRDSQRRSRAPSARDVRRVKLPGVAPRLRRAGGGAGSTVARGGARAIGERSRQRTPPNLDARSHRRRGCRDAALAALDARRGVLLAVHDPARRDDRERHAALDPARPGGEPRAPAVDGRRLRAAARLADPGRRHARRPLRAEAHLPARLRPVHRVLGRLRAVVERRHADRLSRPAGRRCGAAGAVVAVDPDPRLRARAAAVGDRHVGDPVRARLRHGAGDRRRAAAPLRLGGDLLGQRADRRRRSAGHLASRARVEQPAGAPPRPGRRRAGLGRALLLDVRPRPHGRAPLAVAVHARPSRRGDAAGRRLPRLRGAPPRPDAAARLLSPARVRDRQRRLRARLRGARGDALLRLALLPERARLDAARDRLLVARDERSLPDDRVVRRTAAGALRSAAGRRRRLDGRRLRHPRLRAARRRLHLCARVPGLRAVRRRLRRRDPGDLVDRDGRDRGRRTPASRRACSMRRVRSARRSDCRR